MGYSLSWIGVQSTTAHELYAKLGVFETGELGDYVDFALCGQPFAHSSYLLLANKCDHAILSNRVLASLSLESGIVACAVEEHVMFSSAEFWQRGRQVWRIEHRGDDRLEDLTVKGPPPANFAEVRVPLHGAAGGRGWRRRRRRPHLRNPA